MTIIAACKKNNSVVMAGDRAYTDESNGSISLSKSPKIFQPHSNVLIGVAGDGNICQDILDYDPPRVTGDIYNYIRRVFVKGLRISLKDYDLDQYSYSMLIGVNDRIFSVEEGVVLEHDYHAIGSGGLIALGVLYVCDNPVVAVEAACHHMSTCAGEIDIFTTSHDI